MGLKIEVQKSDGQFKTITEIKDEYVVMILKHTNNNKAKASALTGMTIKTIYNRLDHMGLSDEFSSAQWKGEKLKRAIDERNEETAHEDV